MENNVMELYNKLDINNQRNELSSLLIKINELLNQIMINKNIPMTSQVKNYDLKNKEMSETDMLAFVYEDLWNIKTKVLALLIESNKEKNL